MVPVPPPTDPTVALLLEQDALHENAPGWDRAYLIDEARAALDQGMPEARARILYGAAITEAALRPEAPRA